MKKYLSVIIFAILGSVFFSILMGEFNIYNLLIGFFAGGLATIVINGEIEAGIRKLPKYFKHFFILIKSIFVSSYKAIIGLLRQRNTRIEIISSDKDISPVFRANLLTLTPETVTLDKESEYLTVLEFEKDTKNDKYD